MAVWMLIEEGGRGKGDWLSQKEGEFEKVTSVNDVCPCHEAVSLVAAAQAALPPCALTKPLSSALYFDGFLIPQAGPGIVFHRGA